jgi:hypothetical protein
MMLAACSGWFQHVAAWAHASIFGELWFQNAILAVSAAIAILTISTSSRHERRRATVDIVRDQQKDEVLIAARATIRSLEGATGKIDFGPILAEKDSKNLRAIYDVLNSYKFMASGMRTGAFDENTYKRMYYNTVVTHWEMFRGFIEAYREKYKKENPGVSSLNADTLYQDFQSLATDWSKRPLKRIRTRRNSPKATAPAPKQRLPQAVILPQTPNPPQPKTPSNQKTST